MGFANDVYGTVFERGSAIFLARLIDGTGASVIPANLASLSYTVYRLDDGVAADPIAGHDHVALPPTQVLFNSLQLDDAWTVDTTGYNFRHQIDVSAQDAFPAAGASYQVRYEAIPVSGQKLVFRFQLRAI